MKIRKNAKESWGKVKETRKIVGRQRNEEEPLGRGERRRSKDSWGDKPGTVNQGGGGEGDKG